MEEKVIPWTVVEGEILAIKLGEAIWVKKITHYKSNQEYLQCSSCGVTKYATDYYPGNRATCKLCIRHRQSVHRAKIKARYAAIEDRKISNGDLPLVCSNSKDSKSF